MKVCFVGLGSIAGRHIRNLRELCMEQAMTLHIDVLRRSSSNLTDHPDSVDKVYTSRDELPTDYDVIFITNPTEYHADTLISLHENAKHFFIEKPIATPGTVNKLKDFVFRQNSVYYVASPLRYCNVIRYLKEHINPKEVYAVRCISSSYLPEWRPGKDYRNTCSAHKELGGGVSIDLIHEWDYLTFLFGIPVKIEQIKGKYSELEIDSEDLAVYIAEYKGMVLELHLDYFGRKTERMIELYMRDDTVKADLVENRISFLKSGENVDLGEDRDAYQKREMRFFLNEIEAPKKKENGITRAIQVLGFTQGKVSLREENT